MPHSTSGRRLQPIARTDPDITRHATPPRRCWPQISDIGGLSDARARTARTGARRPAATDAPTSRRALPPWPRPPADLPAGPPQKNGTHPQTGMWTTSSSSPYSIPGTGSSRSVLASRHASTYSHCLNVLAIWPSVHEPSSDQSEWTWAAAWWLAWATWSFTRAAAAGGRASTSWARPAIGPCPRYRPRRPRLVATVVIPAVATLHGEHIPRRGQPG
jgi:hypothetical protein